MSWAEWREENPKLVQLYKALLANAKDKAD